MTNATANLKDMKDNSFHSKYGDMIKADCLLKLKQLQGNSDHLLVSDPPSFTDGMDGGAKHARSQKKIVYNFTLGVLPNLTMGRIVAGKMPNCKKKSAKQVLSEGAPMARNSAKHQGINFNALRDQYLKQVIGC